MEFQTITIRKTGGIAILLLNRPQALNAVTSDMLWELQQAVDLLNADEEVKSVIIAAEGSKAFSVGGNIKEEAIMDADESKRWSNQGHKLMDTIENSPKPFIAAIHGYTIGAGCELAICCDFIIAAEDTVISAPAIKLGMICGFGANVRLPRIIGRMKAKEMLMMGKSVDAAEAYRIGLINEVVVKESLLSSALELSEQLINKSSAALGLVKKVVNYSMENRTKEAITYELDLFVEASKLEDKKEGMNAFLEKRTPHFIGR